MVFGWNSGGSETQTQSPEDRLREVLAYIERGRVSGRVSDVELAEIRRIAGVASPAVPVTIRLQVRGNTDLLDNPGAQGEVERALGQLARGQGLELVPGATTIDVG